MNKKYSVDEALVSLLKWRNLLILIVTTAVFMVGGVLIKGSGATATVYQQFTDIQLNMMSGNSKGVVVENGSDPMFVSTYADVLRGSKVLTKVKEQLKKQDVQLSVSELKAMTSTENNTQTSIVKIKVDAGSAKQASQISSAYRKVALSSYSKYMARGKAAVINSGSSAKLQSVGLSRKKMAFYSAALGFVLAFAVLFLRAYFDQKVRTRNYLVKRLEIRVLNPDSAKPISADTAANVMLFAKDATQIGIISATSQVKQISSDLARELTGIGVAADLADGKEESHPAGVTLHALNFADPAVQLAFKGLDAAILVVEAGQTTKDLVLKIQDLSATFGIPLIGVIFISTK